jgi:hypothetical protein
LRRLYHLDSAVQSPSDTTLIQQTLPVELESLRQSAPNGVNGFDQDEASTSYTFLITRVQLWVNVESTCGRVLLHLRFIAYERLTMYLPHQNSNAK